MKMGLKYEFDLLTSDVDKLSHPVSWIGQSIFWSGGSMTQPNLPKTFPPASLSACLVNGALLLLANYKIKNGEEAEAPTKRAQDFFGLAEQIASNQDWELA